MEEIRDLEEKSESFRGEKKLKNRATEVSISENDINTAASGADPKGKLVKLILRNLYHADEIKEARDKIEEEEKDKITHDAEAFLPGATQEELIEERKLKGEQKIF